MSISKSYVRQQAFYKNLVRHYNIVQDPEAIKSLVSEFGKIGANLNQIARFFNTGGMRSLEMEDDIHDCISMLFQLRKRVLRLGGDHYSSDQTSGVPFPVQIGIILMIPRELHSAYALSFAHSTQCSTGALLCTLRRLQCAAGYII